MTAARPQSTPAKKPTRRRRRLVLKSLRKTSVDDLAFSVEPSAYNAIAKRERKFGAFLKTLGQRFSDAEKTGETRRYTVKIGPAGEITLSELKSAAPVAATATTARSPDALDRALEAAQERGRGRIAEILAQTGMLTAEEFSKRLGVSHTTVHDKRRKYEVLALTGPKRGYRFPAWQLTEAGEVLPGLPAVFEVLGDHPWRVYRFLLGHHGELDGRTALDAMKGGQAAAVVAVARNVAEGVPG